MNLTELASQISLWTGCATGFVTVVDWILPEALKDQLRAWAKAARQWLAKQKAGEFTKLLRRRRVQVMFSVLAHGLLLFIGLAFFARVHLGIPIDATLDLGKPRIYNFQFAVDSIAIVVSAIFMSWKFHPRLANWLGEAQSMPRYFLRALACFLGVGFLAVAVIITFQAPVKYLTAGATTTADIERALGGKLVVVLVHALSAIVTAPVFAEIIAVMFILYGSLFWIAIVFALWLLAQLLQFTLLRIAEYPKGPVLGVSGLLIAIGVAILIVRSPK